MTQRMIKKVTTTVVEEFVNVDEPDCDCEGEAEAADEAEPVAKPKAPEKHEPRTKK